MEKERYYFGFRFENALKKRIKQYCEHRSLSLNTLVNHAFKSTAKLHDKQRILLNRSSSGFAVRINLRDRVDAMLILEAPTREMVRNFAVCYRKSMAEIIRIALELFLDFQDKHSGKIDDIKHYYNKPQYVISCTVIGLYPAFPPKIPPSPGILENYIHT